MNILIIEYKLYKFFIIYLLVKVILEGFNMDKKRKKQIAIVCSTLLVSGVLILSGINKEEKADLPASQNMGEDMEKFNEAMFKDSLPIAESLLLLNEKLDSTDMPYKDNLIGPFVEKISIRAEKLNTTYRMFKSDFVHHTSGDIKKMNKHLNPSDPMLSAILEELEEPYFILLGTDIENSSIGVNYKYLQEKYGKLVTDDFNSRLTLMNFSNGYSYFDLEKGYPIFENVYARHNKINELISKKSEKSYYLMSQDYDTYYLFLGINNFGMNESETKYSEEALKSMEAFVLKHKHTDAGKDLEKVMESMKSEGMYGKKTEEVAVTILGERFGEYIKMMEEEQELNQKNAN